MKKFSKKYLMMLVCTALLLTFAVSGTVAYLVDSTGEVENVFQPASVPPDVVESFDGSVKSNVAIKNTGNIDAYIRAMVVITWQNADGEVYPVLPVADTDYSISWGASGWDRETTDGFYYHTTAVAPGTNTAYLITRCEPLKAAPADGYTLHVEILAQSIQAEPTTVVANQWGVTVAADGTISK